VYVGLEVAAAERQSLLEGGELVLREQRRTPAVRKGERTVSDEKRTAGTERDG